MAIEEQALASASDLDSVSDLLRAIGAYVPRLLLHRVIAQELIQETFERQDEKGDMRPGPSWEERSRAALLFADVSGFTVMSESLARLGKEGAEELTSVLNAYFTMMIEIVHRYGGAVIKFGGDAITCHFTNGVAGVRQACTCALEMQRQMAQFAAVETKGGVFNLRMKIGISAGSVLFMSVGQPEEGLEYVLAGHALDRMAEAEHHATAGEVVVDAACLDMGRAGTVELEAPALSVAERREGFLLITDMGEPATPLIDHASSHLVEAGGPVTECDLDKLIAKVGVLTQKAVIGKLVPYVPQTIYEQIIEGHHQLLGEHRWVVSLFVNFKGLEYDEDPNVGAKLQTYFTTMQTIIHRYGGRLNRVITGDKGSLLHIIFGAPLTHEDNEERAIGCALEMQQVALHSNNLNFITDQRIGVAGGDVFAGNVGSEQRREYTVMGDVVNLSARLMQAAAPGEILIERQTARRAEQDFICEDLDPIRVKGKAKPIPVSRAVSVRRATKRWEADMARARRRDVPLVGRQSELDQIARIIGHVLEGHGQLLVISGEAGVGKSRLLKALIAMAREAGLQGFQGDCLSYGTQTPYLPWVDFLSAFFDLGSLDEMDTAGKVRRVQARIIDVDPELRPWVPLIAQLFGLPMPDNALTVSLNAQLRKQRIFEIVLTLLRHQAGAVAREAFDRHPQPAQPFLMVFEDVHWIDAISLEMLNYVARNIGDVPILLVALHRPTILTTQAAELSEWSRYDYYHRLDLVDISAEDAMTLIKYKLRMDTVPDALYERVLRGETRLNPYFVEEVINALVDQGYLVAIPDEDDEDYYVISGKLSEAEIPDSIQALVMSRIDRLDESSKLTVKVASSIGRTFAYQVLLGIYPVEIAPERLLGNLEKLDRIDLTPLDKPAPDLEYIFKHITTQEVAYESLLYKHRRELHYSIGQYIEMAYSYNLEEYYELLAYHYAMSEDQVKGWDYLVKAGDKARDNYANEAAIEYYTRALTLSLDSEETYCVHESLADIYRLIGQYDQATEQYYVALKAYTSVEVSDTSDVLAAQQSPYIIPIAEIRRKIAKTWELQGRYDEAMQHLDLTREILDEENRRSPDLRALAALVRVYNDMAWIQLQRGSYAEALALCEQGVDTLQQLPQSDQNYRVRAELQHTLGSIYVRMKEYEKSVSNFQISIESRQAIGDFYNMARTYNNLAAVYWNQSDYQRAVQFIHKSLEMCNKVGYTYGTAMCYNNLGAIHYTLGEYSHAVEYYEKSLEIRQQIGDLRGIAEIYNNLGEVHQSRGSFQDARDYLQEAIELLKEIGEKRILSDACKLLAEVELASGRSYEALDYCQQSLDLAREIGDRNYEGQTYRVLGQAYRASGDLIRSRDVLQASVEILERVGDRLELAHSLYELGLTLMALNDAEARANLQKAAQLFEALGMVGELEKVNTALHQS
jgi:class 3 adenylate cyclase/predicted ATPase